MSTLRGRLDSIALVDVLQLLHANRKTGELLVTGDRRGGVLYLVNGEVVHAETARAQGEPAAFDILEWASGGFEFVATAVKAVPSIRRTVPDLLMEAARTTDARRHLSSIFPDLQLVPWPTLRQPGLTRGLKFFPEDLGALVWLDGHRTFLEIIKESGMSDVSVLQACATLQDAGRLELLKPTISAAVAASRPSLFGKSGQVKLATLHEAHWQTMGPYGAGPIARVRLLLPGGPAVAPVKFVQELPGHTVGIPRELMKTWELPEGIFVAIRPAP